jgi:S-adenosyl-L-methionine hydrolase (adenosine-forming)
VIVTLLTDFGTSDGYAAAMKGVLLSRDARIRIIDVTHEVPPHDIRTGAYLLMSVFPHFPPATVHVVVVDPGVGSSRLPIAAAVDGRYVVGPDNGVIGHLARLADHVEVREVRNPLFHARPHSATFHGRDLFAPVAAHLATGFPFQEVGPTLTSPVLLEALAPRREGGGALCGRVLHVDRFGNCITSFRPEDLEASGAWLLRAGGHVIDEFRSHYADGTAARAFAIWGSAGFLEISVQQGSAAERLALSAGSPITAVPARGSRDTTGR